MYGVLSTPGVVELDSRVIINGRCDSGLADLEELGTGFLLKCLSSTPAAAGATRMGDTSRNFWFLSEWMLGSACCSASLLWRGVRYWEGGVWARVAACK